MKKISTVQFYREIMEEANCDFKEAVQCVLNLQKEGKIEIISFDNFGIPSVFYRTDKKPKNKDDYKYIDDVEKAMGLKQRIEEMK